MAPVVPVVPVVLVVPRYQFNEEGYEGGKDLGGFILGLLTRLDSDPCSTADQ